MPFLAWQKDFLSKRLELQDLPFDGQLSFQSSEKKNAIIESWQFSSPQFRKIRMTYIDAGTAAQVNCLAMQVHHD
jgi:15,16-dihydrobiliverdin:ferredoxin oxidoreductase